MDRQTRHDIKHDKFLDEIGNAYTFAAANRSKLILATVVLAVLAAAAAGFVMYRSAQEDEAQIRLAEGIRIMSASTGTAPVNPADPAYETKEEQQAAARPVFEEVIEKYGYSDAADVARLYLAGMDLREGREEQARAELQEFVDEHRGEYLAGAAAWSLYNNRLASGDAEEVIAELQSQLDDPEPDALPTPALLALLARAHELHGDDDAAKAYWKRIAEEYNDSPYGLEANRKLVSS